ncbi:hypothetical protein PSJE_08110 [Pseudomonas jessenii]|nr:hypothetical protein PSJE_08110 [Pseudomonas jessenii]
MQHNRTARLAACLFCKAMPNLARSESGDSATLLTPKRYERFLPKPRESICDFKPRTIFFGMLNGESKALRQSAVRHDKANIKLIGVEWF